MPVVFIAIITGWILFGIERSSDTFYHKTFEPLIIAALLCGVASQSTNNGQIMLLFLGIFVASQLYVKNKIKKETEPEPAT